MSDKLAAGDFHGLRGMVTDDVIDELREKLADWTDDQRAQLRSKSEDMCRSLLRSIETVEQNGTLLAKLSMVYHVVEGFQDLTEGKFDGEFQKKVSAKDFLRKSSEYGLHSLFFFHFVAHIEISPISSLPQIFGRKLSNSELHIHQRV